MATAPAIDALGQFVLRPAIGSPGSYLTFTNSNVMMLLAAVLIVAMVGLGVRRGALVPGRMQAVAEMMYEFTANLCSDMIGPGWKTYFPFVFTLFMFILFGNTLGLFPIFFEFTAHIAITVALSLIVFVLSVIIGFVMHGFRFFTFFVPPGAPKLIAPILVPIEVISFLSRPVSLSIRLFANMVAGHVLWEVFAGFMLIFAFYLGTVGIIAAVLPLAINVALVGFELLIAALQAYVFAVLTALYIHDSVHLHA